MAAFASAMLRRDAAGDADQPGAMRRSTLERGKASVGDHEYLLRDVLPLGRRDAEEADRPADLGVVLLVEFFDRGRVSPRRRGLVLRDQPQTGSRPGARRRERAMFLRRSCHCFNSGRYCQI
jgi:hypothetical protein